MDNSIVVVTNGSIPYSEGRTYLPLWERSFYMGLLRHFDRVIVWSDVRRITDKSGLWDAGSGKGIRLKPLAHAGANRVIRFVTATTRMIRAIISARRLRSNVYIFYPGRNGFILALLLRVLRYPY